MTQPPGLANENVLIREFEIHTDSRNRDDPITPCRPITTSPFVPTSLRFESVTVPAPAPNSLPERNRESNPAAISSQSRPASIEYLFVC